MRTPALAAAISLIAGGACIGSGSTRPLASLIAASHSAPDPLPPPDRLSPEERIRTVSAAPIRTVSAAEVAVPARPPAALPAPHRGDLPPPPLRVPVDLRALVGHRDRRDPLAAVLGWSRALGGPAITAASGAELVAWATETRRLRAPTETPLPGDLLVFDQATSDAPSDLVAIAVARDARGVTDLVYLASGIVRRGLLDASRPSLHRDPTGATVNTYVRHGKRWPTPGTHYLAGELLAHIIRTR